jgi:hypothetical protein
LRGKRTQEEKDFEILEMQRNNSGVRTEEPQDPREAFQRKLASI